MAKNNDHSPRRPSKGRQKVPMIKMAKESNLQVTFSKRRTGLFKKASELCTLCGIEMALVVFSPGKKVFSFGHPSVEAILNRFAGTFGNHPSGSNSPALHFVEAHRNVTLCDLNSQLSQVAAQVDAERRHGEQMNQRRREAVASERWWEAPVEMIDDEGQLLRLSRALEEMRDTITLLTDSFLVHTSPAVAMDIPGPSYGRGRSGAGVRRRSSGGQVVYYSNNMNNGPSGFSYYDNIIGPYGRGFF